MPAAESPEPFEAPGPLSPPAVQVPVITTHPDRWPRLCYALTALLTGLLVAPIWSTDIMPLVDAGSHLHLITILHGLHLPVFSKHYIQVHAIVPYISYYAVVDWLAWLRDVEWANRVVLTLCLIAVPLSALSLLRAAGHSRWLVLGVLPWLLNADFFMGFFNFLASIPLLLWLMAAHLRWLRAPTWRRGLLVVALLCAMATTHYLLWAIALVLLPVLALQFGLRHGWRRALWWPVRDVLLGLPSIGVLLPWFLKYFVFAEGVTTSDQTSAVAKGSLLHRLAQVYAGEHLGPVDNLRQLFDRMFDTVGAQDAPLNLLYRPGELVSLLWVIGLCLWIVANVRQPREMPILQPAKRFARTFAISGDSYTGWLLGWATLLYFVFPQHLLRPIWLHGVNFRLIEVLAMLGVVALPLRPLDPPATFRWRTWGGTACMIVASLVLAQTTWRCFGHAREEYGAIRQAYGTIPEGRAVLTLRSKRQSHWFRYHIFNGIGEYYGVMRRGYVPYSFADTSSKPVVVNRETAYPAPSWDAHEQFTWQDHGRFYDYIALFDDVGVKPSWLVELPRSLVPVFHRGRWTVLRNPTPDPWPEPTPLQRATQARDYSRNLAGRLLTAQVLSEVGLQPAPLSPVDAVLAPWISASPWGFINLQPLEALGWPVQGSTTLRPQRPPPWHITPERRMPMLPRLNAPGH
jgi:hypothetical protein